MYINTTFIFLNKEKQKYVTGRRRTCPSLIGLISLEQHLLYCLPSNYIFE